MMRHYLAAAFFVIVTVLTSAELHGSEEHSKTSESHDHHIFQRSYAGDNWIKNLVYNLFAYATVIVPAYFFIKFVKKAAALQPNKRSSGIYQAFVDCFVLGNGTEDSSHAKTENPSSSSPVEESVYSYAFKLIFCIVGLQTSYLTWGVLQERIMTRTYGEDKAKFTDSQFLVFMNRVLAFIVSGMYLSCQRTSLPKIPFYKFSFSSLSNILSSWCQYEALKFVSFPTQVLGKTSKMIPVMLMGKVISKKTYQWYEYIVALGISCGVSMFLLSVGHGKHTSTETTVAGAILMLGYMGFDSFTSNWQSELFSSYSVSSTQMMFGVNVFSSLFTLVSLLQTGGLIQSVTFMFAHREFATHAILISCMSATGQLFIFYTISKFGPLVFTTIMVTRQTLSILLSCIIYHHTLTTTASFGILIVFVSLFLQIYAKWRIRQLKKKLTPMPV